MLPRDAFSQLQQRDCKRCLRETLAQQSEAGRRIDEDMHSGIPDGTHVACRELYGDDNVVNRKDQLHDTSQRVIRLLARSCILAPRLLLGCNHPTTRRVDG